jgi:hypothetical protein
VDEGRKDDIELVTAGLAGAAFGLVPGGSLLAAAFSLPLQVAQQRREREELEQIRRQLEDLRTSGATLPAADELAGSEAFMAQLTITMRAAMETDNEDKRRLLRNALMNGMSNRWGTHRWDFARAVARYEPEHVAALHVLLDASGGQGYWLRDAEREIHERLQPGTDTTIPASRFGRILNELASDDFIQREGEAIWPAAAPGAVPQPHIQPQVVAVTLLGVEFLRFVAEPTPADFPQHPDP